ncbi:MAG: DinB family protein [Acidobacteria bacterium]|nr:DinB family protein [Acidobacteriota bacterium]
MTTTITTTPPDRTEAAEYYFTYINQVPAGDILTTLEGQEPDVRSLFESVSDERAAFRYAAGKWSIKEVLAHINDTERLFVFRAFWFARGLEAPLPSFDQTVAATGAAADDRPWQSHVDEFRTVRAASLSFYRNLPADAWLRRGIASGNPFSVRALAYITAGHVAHHVRVLRDRYL